MFKEQQRGPGGGGRSDGRKAELDWRGNAVKGSTLYRII